MRNRLCLILIAFMTAVSFTGCKKDKDPDVPQSETAVDEEEEQEEASDPHISDLFEDDPEYTDEDPEQDGPEPLTEAEAAESGMNAGETTEGTGQAGGAAGETTSTSGGAAGENASTAGIAAGETAASNGSAAGTDHTSAGAAPAESAGAAPAESTGALYADGSAAEPGASAPGSGMSAAAGSEPGVSAPGSETSTAPGSEPGVPTPGSEMSATQWNSIRMLNYLTVLSQEINSSKNSRLFLESAYSSLINNTYPNAVDVRTEAHLEDLLDTLENYRMLGVKRERLRFIYEQNRAKAIKAAIPNPLGLLSAVQSGNPLKAVISVVYMATDAYTSYTSYTQEVELQYLKDGWELDDEEAKEVHNTRTMAFSYMIDMVRNNSLPGDYALNENSVNDFVSWANNSNVVRRIQYLESNRDVYQALGEYWLVLAQSYYENEDYEKCLEAVRSYEEVEVRIFRKDYDYAKVLPLAIDSARELYPTGRYIRFAETYLPLIIKNSDITDWTLRYFAAQTYIDLYSQTEDIAFLWEAYNNQKDVVNYLIDEQKDLNFAYLKDIQKLTEDKKASKSEKKEIRNYNKMLVEQRKTELPPVSEPLHVNCDLLFALAEKLNISRKERSTIDQMLHENGEPLFLNRFLDDKTYFLYNDNAVPLDEMVIEYTLKGELTIPAILLSKDSVIKTEITGPGGTVEYDDWTLRSVDRKKKELPDFTALYTSPSAKKVKYADGMTINVKIYEDEEAQDPDAVIRFDVKAVRTLGILKSITIQRAAE